MTTIRRMREEDADAVRQVDTAAFSPWWRQLTGEAAQRPPRTHTNILACREKDPEGCLVAEADGRVVGCVFSRTWGGGTWGGVGWFGGVAVLPEYQGRGIGKQLMTASLTYLRRDPGRVIGLETMPESPYNLGLYLRRGFQARLLTPLLTKALDQPAVDGIDLPRWSSADAGARERWLADLREATGRIARGLDYSKEVTSTARHSLGETLVLTDGARAIGLSTVWLVGSREGHGKALASIPILALHPAHTDEGTFRLLIDASEALARACSKRTLMVSVNARHAWALERLLGWGYRVEQAMVRMVLAGTDKGPSIDNYVNLSRWAG